MDMVTEAKLNGSETESLSDLPPALIEKPAGLPPGKYSLVGWDLDTTGRRLIDEICQIAAFSPAQGYSQYIMPYGDLNPGARRRHNVRVVTVGKYRMLKDTNTHKILKTKSEISALTDFIEWLEQQRGDASAVILIYHEPRRLSPTMLLEALTRYKLLDRFKAVVAGFTDSYALAADKCKATVKSVSLRVLARVLLDAESMSVDSAIDRAAAAYRIVEHLAQGEQQEVGGGGEGAEGASRDMVETARLWARPVDGELTALAELKKLLERQNTFRPVFAPLLRTAREERKRVTALRRMLADAGLRYEELGAAWSEEKAEGLEKQLKALSLGQNAKDEDIKELIDIFDCHFDPAKEAKGPKPKSPRPKKSLSAGEGGSAGEAGDADDAAEANDSKPAPQNVPIKTEAAPQAIAAN